MLLKGAHSKDKKRHNCRSTSSMHLNYLSKGTSAPSAGTPNNARPSETVREDSQARPVSAFAQRRIFSKNFEKKPFGNHGPTLCSTLSLQYPVLDKNKRQRNISAIVAATLLWFHQQSESADRRPIARRRRRQGRTGLRGLFLHSASAPFMANRKNCTALHTKDR